MRLVRSDSVAALCSLLVIVHVLPHSEEVELNILFVVSFGQSGFNSSGVIPAADIALEDINNAGLLPGYRLTYDRVRDSEVKGQHGLITTNKCGFV